MTLIEVMLAIAILITGLIAIFALLNSGLQSHRRAINETEASMIASSAIAEIRSELMHGGLLPRSDPKKTFNPCPDFPDYQINRQIIELDKPRGVKDVGAGREYFVRVEVRWSERGDNKSIVMQTVVFHNKAIGRPAK
ncbi:MAG TPA: hypothetical protein VEJ63_17045 [Planctomycetota bacterium]|nr:hypothetical protein [Planctomycetota bacterium]